MSATFSTHIEQLNDGNPLLFVLRHVAESGEAGLRIVKTFALDCAERAIPAYEAEYPGDLRVRAAIEVSRRHLRGETTIDEAKTAANAACAAVAAACAAYAAACAAYAANAANAAYAAYAAACAAYAAAADAGDNYDAERRWQRAHLIQLLEAAE